MRNSHKERKRMASVDLHTASFLAALLKTLAEDNQGFFDRLEAHERTLTVDDLVDALAIVYRCQHSDPDDAVRHERRLRREAEAFLENR